MKLSKTINLVAQVKSRPTRGAWIEIPFKRCVIPWELSRPTRGAWIEIVIMRLHFFVVLVAPHTGRVD